MVQLTALQMILLVGLVFALILLAVWHYEDDSFDLRSIITDQKSRVSLYKIGQVLALGVSTWGFVVLISRDKMTEWYFFIYMVTWAGMNIANKIADAKTAASFKGVPPDEPS